MNKKHDLTGKASAAATASYVAARDFDKKHRVHQRVGETARAGYNSAVKFNNDYKVSAVC